VPSVTLAIQFLTNQLLAIQILNRLGSKCRDALAKDDEECDLNHKRALFKAVQGCAQAKRAATTREKLAWSKRNAERSG
jgi:hypothetical protein